MEAQGTDFDRMRELNRRIERLENSFGELRDVTSGLANIVTRLEARDKDTNDLLHDLREKLDETRTKKPAVGAVLGVVFSGLAVSAMIMGAVLAPIMSNLEENTESLRHIQETRWSREDAQRANDLIREADRASKNNIFSWQQRQDDRINKLAREVSQLQGPPR